jgi:hypothetical protein
MLKYKKVATLFALMACVHSYAQDKPKMPAMPDTGKPAAPKKVITDKIKASKKVDGLFTLYQDTVNGSVQMYIKKSQLGKEFIYQSFSLGGPTSLFLNQNMIRTTWVFKMQKSYDKIEFAQVNTNFYYDPKNPVSKAANVDVAESVFYIDKIAAEDDNGYLITVDGLFLSEKLDQVKPLPPMGAPPGFFFNLGGLSPSKSKYSKIRSYSNNTDVLVDLAYENPAPYNGGGKDITDARYVRVKMQHSFLEMPNNDFIGRKDDPRIGYFSQEVDDLTTTKPINYKDLINRWHLKKKDPSAALSEPEEPIVWWIENTTPIEYRQTIKEAGEKWNEAFEKAGFKNAVVMKIMPDTASWDPADIRYNVIRWVSSPYPSYGAIGPSFVNPKTGQILGADITVEWFSGSFSPTIEDLMNTAYTANSNEPKLQLPFSVKNHKHIGCNIASELHTQMITGLTALETQDASPEEIREMHKQFLYYLIMHEMGHTMGLNHNMKASQMLSPKEVHDKSITRRLGLQGSVMDYPAVNVALDKAKQGDYYTTKAGPYDIWAIEYGYKPFSKNEETAGLGAILSRSNEPNLTFGNDADDMRGIGSGIDPRVMVNDMSNDMVAYAEDRFKLINNIIPNLLKKYAANGDESWHTLRTRYNQLNGQRMGMASSVIKYIGGVKVERVFNSAVKPFTPIDANYQKAAMQLIGKYILAPNAFDKDLALLPYLQMQRRGFNFGGSTEDFKPENVVMGMHMGLLAHLFNATTLMRVNNTSLYGNTYSVASIFNDLVNLSFNEDLKGNVNIFRQNLQSEIVKGLANMLNNSFSHDNASKAAALSTLKKIKALVATAVSTNDQTKAHRTNLGFLIDKALAVK